MLAQKQKPTDLAMAIESALDEYLGRHDPVERAKRAKKRNLLRTRRVYVEAPHSPHAPNSPAQGSSHNRMPSQGLKGQVPHHKSTVRRALSASEKQAVFLRDQGRCSFVNERGERCNADRWLHVHHIKPVSRGGSNDLDNLSLLCSYHHDLVHQLSFSPGEGETNWLRSPVKEYVA